METKTLKWSLPILILFVISILLLNILQKKEQIKIGFVGGLTGNSSEIGVDGRNGVDLAVLEVNKAGGIKGQQIQLLVEDDKNNPTVALMADRNLVEQGVKVIIGHMTSGMTELTVPFVNEKNILMISPTISLDSLGGIEDNFLRVIPLNHTQGKILAEVAYQKTKSKHIAVIYDYRNKAFADGVISSFRQQIQSYGGEIVLMEIFDTGSNVNYSRIAKKIAQTRAEGILVIASSSDSAMFCQHFFKEKMSLPIFMPMWPMTKDLIKQGGPAVEGVYLVSYVDLYSTTTAYSQFRKNYYETYGAEPSFSSLLSYESAKILFETMKETPSGNGMAIKEKIVNKRTFQGLQNEILIDSYGDAMRKTYLYQVEKGAFVKVEE